MALLTDPILLGERVREIRAGKNISQDKLASKAGCSRKTIIGLEKGDNCQVHTLLRVLAALGMAIDIVDNQIDLNYLKSLVEPYDGSN